MASVSNTQQPSTPPTPAEIHAQRQRIAKDGKEIIEDKGGFTKLYLLSNIADRVFQMEDPNYDRDRTNVATFLDKLEEEADQEVVDFVKGTTTKKDKKKFRSLFKLRPHDVKEWYSVKRNRQIVRGFVCLGLYGVVIGMMFNDEKAAAWVQIGHSVLSWFLIAEAFYHLVNYKLYRE
jgi:hypothetical protein